MRLDPNNANWHFNLGNALAESPDKQPAVDAFQQCLSLNPKHAGALNNLGLTLYKQARFDEAEKTLRRALEIDPSLAQAMHNLGCVLYHLGRYEESVAMLHQAISRNPNWPAPYEDLGISLRRLGRFTEAIEAFQHGLRLNPRWPDALANLSLVFFDTDRVDDAIAAAREAISIQPDSYLARNALGNALSSKNDDASLAVYTQLAADYPNDPKVLSNYARDLRAVGRNEEALAAFLRASELSPDDFRPASNYLFTLQFQSEDPIQILDAHRTWNTRYAAPLAHDIRHFTNDRNPDRPLRIGYVSPDFRVHVQALFVAGLLRGHDRNAFEIFCYSSVKRPDAVTSRMRQLAQHWREIAPLADGKVVEMIRADRIDILIDLSMHMAGSRPLVFARQPAPIQACWFAYPGTTGLQTMDYRLTDPYLDPVGFDGRYTEQSIRLADTFWCYDPRGMCESDTEVLPDPSELPAERNGFITFGCLNDVGKLNDATLRRWAKIMASVRNSRIHILARAGYCRRWIASVLESCGIGPERIEFIDRKPRPAYLAEYRRIDLCLDTLPYNGHTTSLDAFWMGVPVLTQIGPTLVGRAGFSQLSNLKLPDFCAENDVEFVELGRRWGEDPSGLAAVRRTLRDRMAVSPLMDTARFARSMEAAFRQMWRPRASM
jgi:predicted O-linked N-acetylglucosamine transferase (SPINDLY family)